MNEGAAHKHHYYLKFTDAALARRVLSILAERESLAGTGQRNRMGTLRKSLNNAWRAAQVRAVGTGLTVPEWLLTR